MSKNFIQNAQSLTFVNSGAKIINSGDAVLVGNILAVATGDIAPGDTGILATEGVFRLPKISANVITPGKALTWDISESALTISTAAAGDLTGAAVAWGAAANGATTVVAKIGFIGTITP